MEPITFKLLFEAQDLCGLDELPMGTATLFPATTIEENRTALRELLHRGHVVMREGNWQLPRRRRNRGKRRLLTLGEALEVIEDDANWRRVGYEIAPTDAGREAFRRAYENNGKQLITFRCDALDPHQPDLGPCELPVGHDGRHKSPMIIHRDGHTVLEGSRLWLN